MSISGQHVVRAERRRVQEREHETLICETTAKLSALEADQEFALIMLREQHEMLMGRVKSDSDGQVSALEVARADALEALQAAHIVKIYGRILKQIKGCEEGVFFNFLSFPKTRGDSLTSFPLQASYS